jgi:L-asparaginase
MPITRRPRFSVRCLGTILALVGGLTSGRAADSAAGIAVVRSPAWSPGDAVREGAGEFEVLVSVASLQRMHREVGIVGVGNRHGIFPAGGEQALRFFSLQGVPVAKIAPGGDLASDPEGIFLEAGHLTEAKASAVLSRCLERFGAPPAAANPDRPTAIELVAIRAALRPFREAFALANAQSVALR